GFLTCLPRGCLPLSMGFQTPTTISCGPAGFRASVMSRLKPSYPPWCVSNFLPLTQTVASQLTAPKCSSRFLPAHSFFTSKVRRYQTRSAGFMTPDSADSTGNGTRICPSSFLPTGGSSSFLAAANSHRPLRFIHSGRTIVGRGYSGRTLLGETSLAHFV